jgi:hypothetical protein
MSKKKRRPLEEFFSHPELPTHIFRAGDVIRILSFLNFEKWRLEKFLSGKQYRLSPYGHIGKGKGSWRLFRHADLYRLACAKRMVDDGFTAIFVSKVLQEIEDSDLTNIGEDGEPLVSDIPIYRSDKGPHIGFTKAFTNHQPYYVLPLRQLIERVNKQISTKEKEDEK